MQFTIQQLNNSFKNKLKNVYSNAEIQQLRFMIYEKLLGLTKIQQITNLNDPITLDQFGIIGKVAHRLSMHEPIQYILGETEFFDLKFKINPSVLIPRPETEELVQWVLTECKKPNLKVLDVGTGSGCIAISLAKNMVSAEVFALDISPAALKIACINSTANNASVTFIECNILEAEFSTLPSDLDVIVSNPPYVKEKEKALMKPNVLEFEPSLALFVTNENPLVFYERIAVLGTKMLKKNGFLFFEINEALGAAVKSLLESLNYTQIEIRKDFDGKNRMVKAIL